MLGHQSLRYVVPWQHFEVGLELMGSSKQLHKIREPLHKHFCRKDPLELPAELIENIFSYFEFNELWCVHNLLVHEVLYYSVITNGGQSYVGRL